MKRLIVVLAAMLLMTTATVGEIPICPPGTTMILCRQLDLFDFTEGPDPVGIRHVSDEGISEDPDPFGLWKILRWLPLGYRY